MEFHFNPTINNQTITIPPSSRCVHFYAFLLEQNNQLLPEIWISESEEQQQQWRSIRFNQNHPFLWHASLQLNPNNCNYQFTYRLISESSNQITWLGTPSQDGRINRTTTTTTNQLDLLLNACLVQSTHHSITHIQPDIQYHRITFSAQDEIHLDKQLAEIPYELLAFERSKPVWFTPRPLIHLTELSTSLDTVLLVLADPSHNRLAVMFPISTKQQYSTIRSTSTSPLTICTEYSKDIHSPITLVLITGPCSQLSRMMAVASGAANHSPNQSQEYTPRGLGYCTWDSLGPEYKLSQVLTILDSFQAAGIDQTLDRVLLDDGWQDVSGRALAGWDANKTWLDSSSSLASAIQAIRDHHRQAIKFVGVWITITGYWHGLDPESELMRQFQLQKWTLRHHPSSDATPPSPVHWFLPSRAQLRPFWNSYFGYLKSAGVDFVKIDNQAGLDQLLNCESDATEDPSVYKITLLDLLDELIPLHFGQGDPDNKVIHSMAHSPHIWLREYPLVEEGCSSSSSRVENSQKIMRTSDDFFPDLSEPDGHRWHILSNAFMSLVAQGRGFIPDFDMTMSGHEWGGYHACMRAFSSAPIYLTDRRGQHSLPLVEQLAAPLKANPSRRAVVQARDGAGVVLSSCALGQPALDLSSATTPWGLLKVGLAAPYAGGALVGLWNVKQKQGSSEDALSTKAVDILTARDIAEAMLSLSLDDQPKLSTKQAMSPERKTSNLAVVCLRKSQDSAHDPAIHRLELLSDFEMKAEMDVPLRSSRPVVESVLDGTPEGGYEVWRIATLFDLPVETPEDCVIQVASLGLLNQFVGLCGVTISSGDDTRGTSISRHLPAADEHQESPARGEGLVTYMVDLLRRPGVGKDTHCRKPVLKKLLVQLARHPLRTIVTELRTLGRLVCAGLSSLLLFLLFSPLTLGRPARPAPPAGAHEVGPHPPESLVFESPYSASLGFLVLVHHPTPSAHHRDDGPPQTTQLASAIQIHINGHPVSLSTPLPRQQAPLSIQILDPTPSLPSPPPDIFFLRFNPHLLTQSHFVPTHQSWSIQILRPKK